MIRLTGYGQQLLTIHFDIFAICIYILFDIYIHTECFVTYGTHLIVRLKIMKKSHINICSICLRLWDIMNFPF